MAFQSAISGLNAFAKNLDVIGNNIANAGTVGFKASRAVFADVFASSSGGAGSSTVGTGVRVSEVQQQFTPGNVSATNNPLDIAIDGRGFYRLDDNGFVTFSRNGQFHIDKDGFIVNSGNQKLTGYGVDTNNAVVASSPVPIRLSTTDIAPRTTSQMAMTFNLDSRADPIAVPFSATNPATYTSSSSISMFDSLGNAHNVTYFFQKAAPTGQWNVFSTIDGGAPTQVDLGAGAGNPLVLNYNSSGALTTPMPIASVTFAVTNGAASPVTTQVDFTGSSQYGSPFAVSSINQNGSTSGRLVGLSVAEDGVIQGRYSNGQANTLGQVVLANFANENGLRPASDNQWIETSASGQPLVGTPGTGSLGGLSAGAVEESNVDLTQELVNMITSQRLYQANAQTIKTQDQTLQTLVNIR